MKRDLPGFVDLQVNGWKGVDFSAPGLSDSSFAEACRGVLSSGIAAFLPTIITSDPEIYASSLPVIARAMKSAEFAGRVLGVHIEGPFISPEDGARGAHPLSAVKELDSDFLERLIELSDGSIKLLTVAAELKGIEEFIKYATARGICVSLGHQMAGSADVVRAAVAGAKALTHLGNGVPLTVNRHENPILAGLVEDDLTAMLITDGHHLPASLIKIALRVKGIERVVVVSDATALTGLPPGNYQMFGSDVVLSEKGRLYNPATGYLAGSGSSMLQCMNHLASLKILTWKELMQIGYTNPIQMINVVPAAGECLIQYDEDLCRFSVI
ncbi:MAG: amidohydrolase family protein [Kiritimatiellae bacterium]|jgi:N-acetylglucosamine-6-phosphate deacetylase|nr:amidohydrolase family protein [Kiritimatiellia bacterium]